MRPCSPPIPCLLVWPISKGLQMFCHLFSGYLSALNLNLNFIEQSEMYLECYSAYDVCQNSRPISGRVFWPSDNNSESGIAVYTPYTHSESGPKVLWSDPGMLFFQEAFICFCMHTTSPYALMRPIPGKYHLTICIMNVSKAQAGLTSPDAPANQPLLLPPPNWLHLLWAHFCTKSLVIMLHLKVFMYPRLSWNNLGHIYSIGPTEPALS